MSDPKDPNMDIDSDESHSSDDDDLSLNSDEMDAYNRRFEANRDECGANDNGIDETNATENGAEKAMISRNANGSGGNNSIDEDPNSFPKKMDTENPIQTRFRQFLRTSPTRITSSEVDKSNQHEYWYFTTYTSRAADSTSGTGGHPSLLDVTSPWWPGDCSQRSRDIMNAVGSVKDNNKHDILNEMRSKLEKELQQPNPDLSLLISLVSSLEEHRFVTSEILMKLEEVMIFRTIEKLLTHLLSNTFRSLDEQCDLWLLYCRLTEKEQKRLQDSVHSDPIKASKMTEKCFEKALSTLALDPDAGRRVFTAYREYLKGSKQQVEKLWNRQLQIPGPYLTEIAKEAQSEFPNIKLAENVRKLWVPQRDRLWNQIVGIVPGQTTDESKPAERKKPWKDLIAIEKKTKDPQRLDWVLGRCCTGILNGDDSDCSPFLDWANLYLETFKNPQKAAGILDMGIKCFTQSPIQLSKLYSHRLFHPTLRKATVLTIKESISSNEAEMQRFYSSERLYERSLWKIRELLVKERERLNSKKMLDFLYYRTILAYSDFLWISGNPEAARRILFSFVSFDNWSCPIPVHIISGDLIGHILRTETTMFGETDGLFCKGFGSELSSIFHNFLKRDQKLPFVLECAERVLSKKVFEKFISENKSCLFEPLDHTSSGTTDEENLTSTLETIQKSFEDTNIYPVWSRGLHVARRYFFRYFEKCPFNDMKKQLDWFSRMHVAAAKKFSTEDAQPLIWTPGADFLSIVDLGFGEHSDIIKSDKVEIPKVYFNIEEGEKEIKFHMLPDEMLELEWVKFLTIVSQMREITSSSYNKEGINNDPIQIYINEKMLESYDKVKKIRATGAKRKVSNIEEFLQENDATIAEDGRLNKKSLKRSREERDDRGELIESISDRGELISDNSNRNHHGDGTNDIDMGNNSSSVASSDRQHKKKQARPDGHHYLQVTYGADEAVQINESKKTVFVKNIDVHTDEKQLETLIKDLFEKKKSSKASVVASSTAGNSPEILASTSMDVSTEAGEPSSCSRPTEAASKLLMSLTELKPTSIRVVRDFQGTPKGWCYVDFGSEDEVGACVELLNNYKLRGRTLFAAPSNPTQVLYDPTTVFVSCKYHVIEGIRKTMREAMDEDAMDEGNEGKNAIHLDQPPRNQESSNTFVSYTEALEILFEDLDLPVKEVRLNSNKEGDLFRAYVEFKSEETVFKCLEKFGDVENVSFPEGLMIKRSIPMKSHEHKHAKSNLHLGDMAYKDQVKLKKEKDLEFKENQEKAKRTVFIKNLSFETSEASIMQIFSEYGVVEKASLTKNSEGRSRGFGYVQMETEESVIAVVSALDKTIIQGREVSVSISNRAITEKKVTEKKTNQSSAGTSSFGDGKKGSGKISKTGMDGKKGDGKKGSGKRGKKGKKNSLGCSAPTQEDTGMDVDQSGDKKMSNEDFRKMLLG